MILFFFKKLQELLVAINLIDNIKRTGIANYKYFILVFLQSPSNLTLNRASCLTIAL